MNSPDNKLIKIGIFYDGNYFFHVSNYYNYCHERRARISIPGLHDFIRHHVAEQEGCDVRYCHIVDAHYFRGRLSAAEAEERQKLYYERVFDDILMRQGVVTHYSPLGTHGEKGIDVWLALEAFEQAIYKRFNVLVLIASDGDYIPMVRKVNSLGTRIMVLGWDFEFTDQRDKTRNDGVVNNLFLPKKEHLPQQVITPVPQNNHSDEDEDDVRDYGNALFGTILNMKNGYGFIKPDIPGDNVFFYWGDLENIDFNEMVIGDKVSYVVGYNDRGECAKHIRAVKREAYRPDKDDED